MKNKLFLTSGILLGIFNFSNAQIGVNTGSPYATLDVEVQSTYATGGKAGIAAPRLTGDQIEAINTTGLKAGTIIYATAASTAGTPDVTSVGFWYWKDATAKWEPFTDTNAVTLTEAWKDPKGTPANLTDDTGANNTSTNIYYNNGKVGINTADPDGRLTVVKTASENSAGHFTANAPSSGTNMAGLFEASPSSDFTGNNIGMKIIAKPTANVTGNSYGLSIDDEIDLSGANGFGAVTGKTHTLHLKSGDPHSSGGGMGYNSPYNYAIYQESATGIPSNFGIVSYFQDPVGIGMEEPRYQLDVNSYWPDDSGLAFFQMRADSPPVAGKPIGVDTDGKVVRIDAVQFHTNNSSSPTTVIGMDTSGANYRYTGANAIVDGVTTGGAGFYLVTIRYAADKTANCNDYVVLNLDRRTSAPPSAGVSSLSNPAFTYDLYQPPGSKTADFFYTSQIVQLQEGTYYLMAKISGGCTSYNVRSGTANNSFTLTRIK
ncbi:hypothetical protein HNP38_000375 [Chryseobacterium defluvii]|uniref:Uncharacterized protein n=1 Tax=Chryseobacterium defluvii TaxID=160396 RepID=A0A840KC47_9FLAO|nr:hypothetical protein [Chryseobacterium defluvii]MBB4805103.1 hypothetical protein [Chryseobacterium defluvii]